MLGAPRREDIMERLEAQNFIDQLVAAFHDNDDHAVEKAVEAANVALLQDLYRTIARGDFASLHDHFAEDIRMEIVGPSAVPFVGQWQGARQVAEQIASNFSHIEEQRPAIDSVVAQGDMVVVQAREEGRYRATGRSYQIHWVQIFTFRQGKLQQFREIFDSAPMVAACS
jgi:ketosteroid isomerase-like protein